MQNAAERHSVKVGLSTGIRRADHEWRLSDNNPPGKKNSRICHQLAHHAGPTCCEGQDPRAEPRRFCQGSATARPGRPPVRRIRVIWNSYAIHMEFRSPISRVSGPRRGATPPPESPHINKTPLPPAPPPGNVSPMTNVPAHARPNRPPARCPDSRVLAQSPMEPMPYPSVPTGTDHPSAPNRPL
jgi:hypothetical protein